MAAPPKTGGTFSPTDIAQMSEAYETALRDAARMGGTLAVIPALELRQRLAGLVLSAARNGPIRADYLAQAALNGLQSLTASAPLTALLGRHTTVLSKGSGNGAR
jgi:hypothetical protein